VGVVVSSIVFGMLHIQGSTWAEALFMLGVTAAYGAVFALLVVRAEGRLGPAIIAHMGVNIVGVLATVLA
ncbi:MAG: type II CAAX prenyl endopeptidase Rce1 family protein, partial [Acidimicrobiia bacterium]